MYCKDFTPAQLTARFPNGHTLAYYVTECEAYAERASIPRPDKCNDLPACPFALQEAKNDRIAYAVGNFKDGFTDEHIETLQGFAGSPNKKTLFYICLDIDEVPLDDGVKLSEKFQNLLLARHPEFEEPDQELTIIFTNPRAEEGRGLVEFPAFCFFLVQSSKELLLGEQQLRKMGYYDKLDPSDLVIDNFHHHGARAEPPPEK